VIRATVMSLLVCAVLMAQSSPQTAVRDQAASQTSTANFRIAGILINSATGQPVSSATVAVAPVTQGTERELSKSVISGADGRFAITGLSRGKYSLMATAHGFSVQSFQHHGDYATAVVVGPGLATENLTFQLEPDASLEGVVTDENNDPVQYATVRLFPTTTEDGQQRITSGDAAQTDDQGHYRLGHIRPGKYYAAVSARPWYAQNSRPITSNPLAAQDAATLDVTYPLTFYPGTSDWPDATPLQLAPGERQSIDFPLHAVRSLHLRIHTGSTADSGVLGHMIFPTIMQRVFDGYLEPVSNAPVSWISPGVIEISGLTPGHYVLEVPASGANDKQQRGWYREVELAGDMEVSASDATSFASVSGTVLFQGMQYPPAHASIELRNPETGEVFHSDFNHRGEFDLRADTIRPGRYLLGLENAPGYSLVKLAASGARLAGRTLTIGNAAVRINGLAAPAAARINGTVLRDTQPFSGAMVVLVPQDPANNVPLFRRDQSDSDGTFTLSNVVPGQYTVLAIAHGWDLAWSDPTVLEPYLKAGKQVDVPAGETMDVKVEVH